LTYEEVFEWIDDNYDLEDYDSAEEMYYAIDSEWTGRNDFSSVITLDDFSVRYVKEPEEEEEDNVNESISYGGSQGTGDSPSNIEDTTRSPEQNLSSWEKVSSGVKRWLRR